MKNKKIVIGVVAAVVVIAVALLSSNTTLFQGSFKNISKNNRPIQTVYQNVNQIIRPDLTIDSIRLPTPGNGYSTYSITVSNRSNGCSGLPRQNVEVKLYPLYRLWSEPRGIQTAIDADDIYTIFKNVDLCSDWTRYWNIGLPNDRVVFRRVDDGTLDFMARGTLMTMQAMVDPDNKIIETEDIDGNFRAQLVPTDAPPPPSGNMPPPSGNMD